MKTTIMYEQTVTSRMKTAGKKFCSLCMAERVNIFCATNSEGSNKLMNKKSELTGACSCNARFLRLYLKGVGVLTRLPVEVKNWLVEFVRRD